jgi:hypothetical protein
LFGGRVMVVLSTIDVLRLAPLNYPSVTTARRNWPLMQSLTRETTPIEVKTPSMAHARFLDITYARLQSWSLHDSILN